MYHVPCTSFLVQSIGHGKCPYFWSVSVYNKSWWKQMVHFKIGNMESSPAMDINTQATIELHEPTDADKEAYSQRHLHDAMFLLSVAMSHIRQADNIISRAWTKQTLETLEETADRIYFNAFMFTDSIVQHWSVNADTRPLDNEPCINTDK